MAARAKRKSAPKFGAQPIAGIAPHDDGAPQPVDDASATNPADQAANDDARRIRISEALSGTLSRLQMQANEQVRLKALIEERWYDDLRRFHGRYDAVTEKNLRENKGKSRLFANVTRPKTTAWEARLSDLLFPTDDRNWSIEPTPVPELNDAAKQAAKAASMAAQKANEAERAGQDEEAAQLVKAGNDAAQHTSELEDDMAEAARRSKLMEAEVDDQLEESSYNIRCREAVHDLCKLGTGIMKGPVASQRKRRSWVKQDGQSNVYTLGMAGEDRPSYMRVDPWNFFPDMTARTAEEAEFNYERHLWNAKDLRSSARYLGFDEKATGELLMEKPREPMPPYIAMLREITSNTQPIQEARYQVWEYRGPLEREDLFAIGSALGEESVKTFLDASPLDEVNVVLWFCQGKLLKFGPGPLDSCETVYSVVPFERDDTSMFGFGVPFLMADSQAAKNAAWRMIMDNAALSVGPQIVIDKDAITPADNDWNLKSMKVWLTSTTSLTKLPEGYKPFQTYDIPSRQEQLTNIIELADRFADEETSMPRVAEGDEGNHIQTAQGMSMMMNSANVVFRRVVKNIDDLLTIPNIRRIYDWNMQFSKREDIKGDYEVKARGSSVLIVRELQLQNLNTMLANYSAHPVIGPMGKWSDAFRKYVQASHISASEIVKSDDVIEREAKQRAQQAAQIGAQATHGKTKEEMDHEKAIHDADNQAKLQVAELVRETKLMELAQQQNMTTEQLRNALNLKDMEHQHKERLFAAEAALPKESVKHIGGAEFE